MNIWAIQSVQRPTSTKRPQAWDTAAGCLLVREAGGFVTDYRGRALPICDAQVIAGNDQLHSRLHKILAGALKA